MAEVFARIADLPVATGARLTEVTRKHLRLLLVEELANKRSLLHAKYEQREREIMERYRQEVGYEELKAALDEQRVVSATRIAALESKIQELGLTEDGEAIKLGRSDTDVYIKGHLTKITPKLRKAAERLGRLLDAIKDNAPDAALQSKLEARLLIAQTVGEAVVILHEVMGNGVLPGIPKHQLLTHQG